MLRGCALALLYCAPCAQAGFWNCDAAPPPDSEATTQAMDPGWNPDDTCAAELFLTPTWPQDTAVDAAKNQAAFTALHRADGPWDLRWRDRAQAQNWSSRFEGGGDTLEHAQLRWSGNAWTFAAGDREDRDLRMRPVWLPRRVLPRDWVAAEDSFPLAGTLSAPRRMAAGYSSEDLRVYGLEAWQSLQPQRTPPWEEPWDLHHQVLGAQTLSPWSAAAVWTQTQISRSGMDSVSEHLASLSLTSPLRIAECDWAWNGTRDHPAGSEALGLHLRYHFGAGEGEFLLRRFGARWSSVWDSTWMDDAVPEDSDTAASDWGAGGFALRLRLPLGARPRASFIEGESWQSWGAGAAPHGSGIRGLLRMAGPGLLFSCRGLVREYAYSTGTVSHYQSLWWTLETGARWRCQLRAFQTWQTHVWKQGEALALTCPGRVQWRPGLRLQYTSHHGFEGQWLAGLRCRLFRAWSFEAETFQPLPFGNTNPEEWKLSVRYAGN